MKRAARLTTATATRQDAAMVAPAKAFNPDRLFPEPR